MNTNKIKNKGLAMAEMKAERKSILDYLSKNNFLIPMYQRPYTWGEDECEQLWDDISNFFEESRQNKEDEYFLGTALIARATKHLLMDNNKPQL